MELINMQQQYTAAFFDIETGQNIIRDMTADEIAQHKIDVETFKKMEEKRLNQIAAKKALFERLGITEEEAQTLGL